MFNSYVWKQEFWGDHHEMAHIWAMITNIWPGFQYSYFPNLQLVLYKRLTLSAALIFVTEGMFIYIYFLLFEENHQNRTFRTGEQISLTISIVFVKWLLQY